MKNGDAQVTVKLKRVVGTSHRTRTAAFVLYLVMGAMPTSAGDLIASYRFDTNGADCLGRSPPFILTNGPIAGIPPAVLVSSAPFTNGVLYVNGLYDPNGHLTHYLGTAPIQDLLYDTFTVSLDFYPLPRKRSRYDLSKLEDRINDLTRDRYLQWRGIDPSPAHFKQDSILTGGYYHRWLGFNRQSGVLNLTLNNHSFTHRFEGVAVKPGCWHNLICSVDLRHKQILTMFDGQPLEAIRLPPDFRLEVVGSPQEGSDRQFTFVDGSNGSVFYGYVAHLKLFGRSLNDSELPALFSESLTERPSFPRRSRQWLAAPAILAVAVLAVSLLVGLYLRRRRDELADQSVEPS